jgi:hypothetical protein
VGSRQVRRTGAVAERLSPVPADEAPLARRNGSASLVTRNFGLPQSAARRDRGTGRAAAGRRVVGLCDRRPRYTSQQILNAEQRMLTTAGRDDGAAVDSSPLSWRCWKCLRMALPLMPARQPGPEDVHLRCRLELAITPAGAERPPRCAPSPWPDRRRRPGNRPRPIRRPRRTPASRPTPWPNSPGASKNHDLPDWAAQIDRRNLIIIDEASDSATAVPPSSYTTSWTPLNSRRNGRSVVELVSS